MSKRIAVIMSPKDLGASGTEPVQIKVKNQISRLSFFWEVTNVTVSVMLDTVLACLTKIELADGGDILFSLSGQEAQALNFFDHGVMPHHAISLTVGGKFEAELSIDFGRFLWDPLYAFLPDNFTNPQLNITWDEDACNTSAVVNALSIYAYVDDAPPQAPVGFLTSKQIKQYAMAASTHEYTDLPTDHNLRRLLLRPYSTDHDPVTLLDTIKIHADESAKVFIDQQADDLYRIIRSQYPRINEQYTLDAAVTAKTLYAAISKNQQISLSYDATAFVTAQSKFAVATWTGAKCALSASVDIKGNNAEVSGECPHNCFPVNFGDPMVPESWLNAPDFGSVEADIASSSDADSGDTTYLVTQQERKYAV